MQAQRRKQKDKLREIKNIITKMPLQVCYTIAKPEFGVRWREVSLRIRNYRLPMVPGSVARVLCRYAKSLPEEDLAEILVRLRLKFVATQKRRKWNVINLMDPIEEDISIWDLIRALPSRVAQVLKKSRAGRTMSPKVETALIGDLLFMSVQMVSNIKEGPVLYFVTPPGQPVALVSPLFSSLLKGCVLGLGYRKVEDAQLFGSDIHSLLRIHDRNNEESANRLASIPKYDPKPVITSTGIDYTNRAYNKKYVEDILGPNPPLLTELKICSSKTCPKLNKKINMKVHIKSDNLANSLKSWVEKGALHPTSELFLIFDKIKSNAIQYND